jgi:predicted nuclease of predicted toxin-antitoxin system
MTSNPHKQYFFLIDVNLPKKFSFFNSANFEHVVDINPRLTDEEIWNYALDKNRVIITKDTDFYNRSISSEIRPKVIFLQLANITLKQLHHFFQLNWQVIIDYLDKGDLIIVNQNQIKVII